MIVFLFIYLKLFFCRYWIQEAFYIFKYNNLNFGVEMV